MIFKPYVQNAFDLRPALRTSALLQMPLMNLDCRKSSLGLLGFKGLGFGIGALSTESNT